MPENALSWIFEELQNPDKFELHILNPDHLISVRFNQRSAQAASIWHDVSRNGAVYRWDHAQGPHIHILPPSLAGKLLEGGIVPYEKQAFYYDRFRMRRVKDGSLAMGVERRDGLVAVMINTDTVLRLMEFLKTRANTISAAVHHISQAQPGQRFVLEASQHGVTFVDDLQPTHNPAHEIG